MIKLYENIKKFRIENGMNQSTLAEKVGYADKGMVSRIEHGKVDLSQSQIEKFAEVLNVSPATLMGWEDEPSDALIELASKYSEPITIPIEIDNPNIAGINRNLEHIDLYKKALSYIYRLNAEGLDNLINYADLLLHDDKYVEKEK